MGRWRPPGKPASPYITDVGYAALQAELNEIWVRRRDVTQHLAAAAAEGDRSENAEYLYRKKELAGIDRRIRYLQKRLPMLKVVSANPSNPDQVYFGATVTLEQAVDGKEVSYRIVGADEFDPLNNLISIDSPLAQVLLKKFVDDTVELDTPTGKISYTIVDVSYQSSED